MSATQRDAMLALAERLESKAKLVRKTECSAEYHAYWRGYAEALDEVVDDLRSIAGREE